MRKKMTATITVKDETKQKLDLFRTSSRQPYDTVIKELIETAERAEDDLELSEETLQAIEEGEREYAEGQYQSLEDVAKELGLGVYRKHSSTRKKGTTKTSN